MSWCEVRMSELHPVRPHGLTGRTEPKAAWQPDSTGESRMSETAATGTRATRLRHGERQGAQRLLGRYYRVMVRDLRS
ncbi:unannotated protein [freshwater metagenome]|uniref:Unannotated protein n=1 Tax=freshwater metagenome TaxID=449393 RepID=A0A6J6ZDA4_9ZZZZ